MLTEMRVDRGSAGSHTSTGYGYEGGVAMVREIHKAMIVVEGGPRPGMYHMDVIEHDDDHWLVPEWNDDRDFGVAMPARMVSLRTIPHARLAAPDLRFMVSSPVPWPVLEGRLTRDGERFYDVVEKPQIPFPLPAAPLRPGIVARLREYCSQRRNVVLTWFAAASVGIVAAGFMALE